jgi:D-lyxose ketol-isomerase
MKRSEINLACQQAADCFKAHGWSLPPRVRWDVTDFGLGEFGKNGLLLINLAEEPEYCEKMIYMRQGQVLPLHTHGKKKEDIICRWGRLVVEVWPGQPDQKSAAKFPLKRSGEYVSISPGEKLTLEAGERVTLVPGVYHAFWPADEECIIGEVSTANDDSNDNFFYNPKISRFTSIEEDEPAKFRIVSESA